MLKKVLSIVMCLSFILSISAFTTLSVSAAASSNYEITQDFEASTAANVSTGDLAIDGKGYFTIGGTADFAIPDLAKPTIANPTGVFFRVEATKPCAGALLINWSNVGFMFVSPDGSIKRDNTAATEWGGYASPIYTIGNMQGYFFCPWNAAWGDIKDGLVGKNFTNMGNCGWGMTDANLIIDDMGYYSVPDPANPDYTSIVKAVTAAHPANAEKLVSLLTGTYNNSVLVTETSHQMLASVLHASGAYDWSVSDASVATIDAAGILTPKKTGTVTVSYTNHNDANKVMTCDVHVVFGYVSISCGDNGSSSKALYGIKLRLRGVPSFTMTDTNVKWSVVSGPATIKDTALDLKGLDSDLASAQNPSAIMVTFTGSGTVVIRASYVIDSAVYSDWTFEVSPNLSYLAPSIIAAQGYTKSEFTAASWKVLQTALAASVKLYNAGASKTTQDDATASKAALDAAVAGLVAVTGTTTPSTPSNNGGGTIPDTGSAIDMFPALIVAAVALGGIALTVKKTILK